MSKITVIVPIYNVEKYVIKCLKSLSNQTFQDFEVWAVNDGSPDNSKNLVKNYSKIDNRIKLIDKKNGGYGSVLQYSINNITSEYFLICDPDDWLGKNALKELYDKACNNNLDIVVSDRYNVYIEGGTEKISIKPDFLKDIYPNKIYNRRQDIEKFAFFNVSPHGKLYRTSLLKGITFPNKVSYTDYLLYIFALMKAKKILYLPKCLSYYLINRPGNTATNLEKAKIGDYITVWQSTLNELKMGKSDRQDILLYRMYTELRFIMSEYSKTGKVNFKDKYWKMIMASLLTLQNYKEEVLQAQISEDSFSKKIFLMGMMNSRFYKIFSKLFVRMNKFR